MTMQHIDSFKNAELKFVKTSSKLHVVLFNCLFRIVGES